MIGGSGVDLSEFPDGVEGAKYISEDDWVDKSVHGIKRSWHAVTHSPITAGKYIGKGGKGLSTLIMDLCNKYDSKDKKKPLADFEEDFEEKPTVKAEVEDDTTSSIDSGSPWNFNDDRFASTSIVTVLLMKSRSTRSGLEIVRA